MRLLVGFIKHSLVRFFVRLLHVFPLCSPFYAMLPPFVWMLSFAPLLDHSFVLSPCNPCVPLHTLCIPCAFLEQFLRLFPVCSVRLLLHSTCVLHVFPFNTQHCPSPNFGQNPILWHWADTDPVCSTIGSRWVPCYVSRASVDHLHKWRRIWITMR